MCVFDGGTGGQFESEAKIDKMTPKQKAVADEKCKKMLYREKPWVEG